MGDRFAVRTPVPDKFFARTNSKENCTYVGDHVRPQSVTNPQNYSVCHTRDSYHRRVHAWSIWITKKSALGQASARHRRQAMWRR
jgi:1,2-phenylacetyl-CoA epoxidase PaaB subunit